MPSPDTAPTTTTAASTHAAPSTQHAAPPPPTPPPDLYAHRQSILYHLTLACDHAAQNIARSLSGQHDPETDPAPETSFATLRALSQILPLLPTKPPPPPPAAKPKQPEFTYVPSNKCSFPDSRELPKCPFCNERHWAQDCTMKCTYLGRDGALSLDEYHRRQSATLNHDQGRFIP